MIIVVSHAVGTVINWIPFWIKSFI